MRMLLTLCICLILQACATSSLNHTRAQGQSKINTRALDASVLIYIPGNNQKESITVDFVNDRQMVISPGQDLKNAAFDVSEHYFSRADEMSFSNSADLILKISGESSLSYTHRNQIRGVLRASLLTMDGKEIYSGEITRIHQRRVLDKHAYYGVYAQALRSFYSNLMAKKGTEIKNYLDTNKPKQPLATTLIDNKTLDLFSTGTGFFINENGNIITNQHVVEQCLVVTIAREGESILSRLVKSDNERDIAVLETDFKTNRYAYFNENTKGERLGERILTLGYPLHGVLSSSVNLTTGNISSLLGVQDDENVYQITAPIQAGNSGGPLINQRGLVAGVVQSKLNALEMSRHTGDLVQNVNFAVKSAKIKAFLSDNLIPYYTRSYNDVTDKSTVDLADEARGYTVQVKCHG